MVTAPYTLYISTASHEIFQLRMSATNQPELRRLAGQDGRPGFSDGPGIAAQFNRPCGLAINNTANILYIADAGNHVIRSLNLSDRQVTIWAGAPNVAGSTNGSRSSVRFSAPEGIVFVADQLFIADTGNHTIRRAMIDTGMVDTPVGNAGQRGAADGTGPSARFDTPRGLVFDSTNVLYIADSGNHAIRRFAISSNAVTTPYGMLGTSGSSDGQGNAARFSMPQDVSLMNGTLFVADSNNQLLRRIDSATGAVTTVAGLAGQMGSNDGDSTAARFAGLRGLAGLNGIVYVADTINNTVRRAVITSPSSSTVSTVVGLAPASGSDDGIGSQARLSSPRGDMVIDQKNLYFADTYNHTIRAIDLTNNVVRTLAGTPGMPGNVDGMGAAARFNQPFGLTMINQRLYITEVGNHDIRKLDLNSNSVTLIAGDGTSGMSNGAPCNSARFAAPQGVVAVGMDQLYISDSGNNQIRRITLDTNGLCTSVYAYAGTVASGFLDGPVGISQFNSPRGIAYREQKGQKGMLYIADNGNYRLREINLETDVVRSLAGNGTRGNMDGSGTAQFSSLSGLALDVTRNRIFVADSQGHTLRQVDLGSGLVRKVVGNNQQAQFLPGPLGVSQINLPWGLAWTDAGAGGVGELYVGDANENLIALVRGL